MASRRTAMRPNLRKAAVLEFVEKRGRASVDELAERFETSVETVRRDLGALAEAGRVRKVHGGAVRIAVAGEGLFEERLSRNTFAKQKVADKLAALVAPGQSIFIDTGSTTLICAERLSRIRGLTIITNSARIAHAFAGAGHGATTILLGGTYRADDAQTVGAHTCAEIGRLRAEQAVLAISALDVEGAYDFSEKEAQVARAMVATADKVTIVADASKLNRRTTYQVCDLGRIDRLILETEPDPALRSALDQAGVAVH